MKRLRRVPQAVSLYYSMKEIEMEIIRETARAKVNFTLPVLGRRTDGYHEVDTVLHSVTLADEVTLTKAKGLSLVITEGAAPAGPENLMWRAAALFCAETGAPGAAMTLEKRIPSEAGLGGGSSDAAAALRGLERLYGTHLGRERLLALAARLGADVPFCVAGGCARGKGVGDVLAPLPAWPGLPLLIVKPPAAVSTAEAYRAVDRRGLWGPNTSDDAERAVRRRDAALLAASLANTFEAALFPDAPALAEVSDALSACGPALMSGSGSAFFLLIGGEAREQLIERLAAAHPDWQLFKVETAGETL